MIHLGDIYIFYSIIRFKQNFSLTLLGEVYIAHWPLRVVLLEMASADPLSAPAVLIQRYPWALKAYLE